MIDEPVFQPQIPERTSDAFSRQWYARGDWKLDEPMIMMKVDRTHQKKLLWITRTLHQPIHTVIFWRMR